MEHSCVDDPKIPLLEERVAWLQKHVFEQDKAMLEMADELAAIRKQLVMLRDKMSTSDSDSGAGEQTDDRPPHY